MAGGAQRIQGRQRAQLGRHRARQAVGTQIPMTCPPTHIHKQHARAEKKKREEREVIASASCDRGRGCILRAATTARP